MAALKYSETIQTHDLRVPMVDDVISARMRRLMEANRYESGEIRTLRRVLKPTDRVLELGAGVGLVSAVAAEVVGGESVTVVEANPDLAPIIAETHRLNGVENSQIITGVAAGGSREETVPFFLREDFWASSLIPSPTDEGTKRVDVPVVDINDLLRQRQPSILVMDIEGAEASLVPELDLSSCRHVIVELHPRVYGPAGVDALFTSLHRHGFAYDARNSRGGTVVTFRRVRSAAASGNRVTAITCMKDEGPFILEWLAYHRTVGISDFLIFTNDCSDGTAELLDHLDARGEVRHLPNISTAIGSPRHQPKALRYAVLQREVRDADWIISMDIDEFLNIHTGNGSITDLTAALPEANVISLLHLDFGNSGVERFADEFVTQQMTLSDYRTPRRNARRGIKTMIHKSVPDFKLTNHRPVFSEPGADEIRWYDGSGRLVPDDLVSGSAKGLDAHGRYELGQINHYPVRSMETYLTKSQKGNVVVINSNPGIDYWRKRNTNLEEEKSILRRLRATRREFRRLTSDPVTARLHQASVEAHRKRISQLRRDPEALALLEQMKAGG